jgi:hypothetical protein
VPRRLLQLPDEALELQVEAWRMSVFTEQDTHLFQKRRGVGGQDFDDVEHPFLLYQDESRRRN